MPIDRSSSNLREDAEGACLCRLTGSAVSPATTAEWWSSSAAPAERPGFVVVVAAYIYSLIPIVTPHTKTLIRHQQVGRSTFVISTKSCRVLHAFTCLFRHCRPRTLAPYRLHQFLFYLLFVMSSSQSSLPFHRAFARLRSRPLRELLFNLSSIVRFSISELALKYSTRH